MSNIIPPMVSSTPPPMDDNMDDDEDDEFGDFASASLSYVADVQPSNSVARMSWETNKKISSPLNSDDAQPQLSHEACRPVSKTNDSLTLVKHNGTCGRDSDPTTTDDDEEVEGECPVFNKCNQAEQNRTAKCDIMRVKEIQQDNTSQDSVVSGTTDSGLCSASQNSEGTSPLPQGEEVDRLSPALNSTSRERVESNDKELYEGDKTVKCEVDSKRTFTVKSAMETSIVTSNSISNNASSSCKSLETTVSADCCEIVSCAVTSEPQSSEVDVCETTDVRDQLGATDFDKTQIVADDSFNDFSEFHSPYESPSIESNVQVLNISSNSFDVTNEGESCKNLESLAERKNFHESDICVVTSTSHEKDCSDVMHEHESLNSAGDEFGAFEEATEFVGSSLRVDMVIKDNTEDGASLPPPEDIGDKFENCDDEFADFATASEPLQSFFPESQSVEKTASSSWADVPVPEAETSLDEVYEDFDDFETTEFHPYEMQSVGDSDKLLERIENLIKELFPTEADTLGEVCFIESEPLMEYLDTVSPVWDKLRVIESSHALTYHWSGSTANKALLSSLGIDSRNILFGPRWNASVPRFAANLGFSPLEPVRATGNNVNSQPSPSVPSSSKELARSTPTEDADTSGNEDSVPAAQFDWTSSGLVNPLDCLEKELQPPSDVSSATATQPTTQTDQLVQRILAASQSVPVASGQRRDGLSTEAIKVLDSIPDLSFLRTKMLMFPVHTPSPEHSVSASDG